MHLPPENSLSSPQASSSLAKARDVVSGISSPVASCCRACTTAWVIRRSPMHAAVCSYT